MKIYAVPKLSNYVTALGTYNVKSFTYEINQHTHAHVHTCTHTHTHTHTHTLICTHMYAHTRTHTHTKVRNFAERDGFSYYNTKKPYFY